MAYYESYDYPEFHSKSFLTVVNIVNMPDPIFPEFNYVVCIPEDGILYFHSGHHTFEFADDVAMLVDGVVVQLNLKGIVSQDDGKPAT